MIWYRRVVYKGQRNYKHAERLKGIGKYYDVISVISRAAEESMCVKLLVQHLLDEFHLGSNMGLQGKRWCESKRLYIIKLHRIHKTVLAKLTNIANDLCWVAKMTNIVAMRVNHQSKQLTIQCW